MLAASCAQQPQTALAPVDVSLADFNAGRLPADAASRELRIRAVLTFVDVEWNLMFVQDGGRSMYLSPKGIALGDAVEGRHVELRGTLDRSPGYATLSGVSVRALDSSRPELPAHSGAGSGGCGGGEGRWTEVRGVVTSIEAPEGPHKHVRIVVRTSGDDVLLWVRSVDRVLRGIVDAEVVARGVCANQGQGDPRPGAAQLFVPSLADITIEHASPERPFEAPVVALGALHAAATLPAHRVHLRGIATRSADGTCIVSDGTGSVRTRMPGLAAPGPPRAVQLVAFVNRVDGRLEARDVLWRTSFASPGMRWTATPTTRSGPLTSIAAVRALSRAAAKEGHPVRLDATVTYSDPGWKTLFVADATGGIYVAPPAASRALVPGDRVRVSGRTGIDFAPLVVASAIEHLGAGTLPPPKTVPFHELALGEHDAQWIEVSGMVRAVRAGDQEHALLELVSGGTRMLAEIPFVPAASLPYFLVDSHVRLRCAAGSLFNADRQLTGLHLFVPSLLDVAVEDEGPPEPAGIRPIASLLLYDADRVGHRVHARGVVTLARGESVFVLDRSGGVEVRGEFDRDLTVGDEVDVLGFATPAGGKPLIEDAVLRRTGRRHAPRAAARTIAELFSGRGAGELVAVEGTVMEHTAGALEHVLVVRGGGGLVTAHVPIPAGDTWDGPRPGSDVRLTGVCDTDAGGLRPAPEVRAVRLLLRGRDDVTVTRAASWWTLGRTLWVLASMTALAMAAVASVWVLRRRVQAQTRTIRAQVEHEAALERRFRDLVQNASDFIAAFDADGRLASVNDAGAQMIGATPADAGGRTLHDVAVPAHRARVERVLAAMREGRPETCELDVERPDGTRTTLELAARPLPSSDGAGGFQVIGRDVIAHKQLAAELQRARETAEAASRAKSEFVANMSHEVRTPMNGIMGMAELLLATPMLEDQRQYVTMMKSSADALLHVINDVLDFSKIEAGRLELDPVSFVVRERLAEALTPVAVRAQQKGLELSYRVAPDVPEAVVADPDRIVQVLVNLLSNAVKFTSAGDVHVDVRVTTPGAVTWTAGETCELELSVSDTGIGIPADKVDSIFEAFTQADSSTTRRFGGTGLGLTICSRLVAMMGGRIGVESAPGAGSTFRFTCPVTVAQPPDPMEVAPVAAVAGLRVLVVDDNAINRRILCELLEGWSMRPETVASGAEALGALAASRTGDPFALVVTDVHMPEMDGFDLAAAIAARPELGSPAIVVLTSAGEPGELERCRRLGLDAYLTKPVASRLLLQAVQRALRKSLPGAAALEAAPALEETADRPARSLRVLLAEDNRVNQRLASTILHKRGHHVVICEDGLEALAAIERERFDVVLMDVQMPELNGFEATARVREIERLSGRPRLPVIALTAHAMTGDRERCLAAGMDDYLSKPVSARALVEMVERVAPSAQA